MAEPRKEVKGLLASGVSQLDVPLCLCADKQGEMSPPANLGGCKASVCPGRRVWRPGGNTWNCLIRVPPGRTDRKASLELFLN